MVTKGNEVAISQHWPPVSIGKVTFTITLVADATADVDAKGAVGSGAYSMIELLRDRLARNGLNLTMGHVEVAQDVREIIEQESEGPF
jgi:hypothetical protein